MTKTKPLGNLDYSKVVAALLVVAIHTSPLTSFHAEVDFIFTRIMARMAVPFFLMVTGYFLLPQYLFGKSMDYRPLVHFIRKTLILYAIAIFLYLPVNLYAGQFDKKSAIDILGMLIFDGTFYHLWYLPASVTGVLLLWILGKKINFKVLTCICLLLYGVGLFGDSYYGFTEMFPAAKHMYHVLFQVFSYTRNGLFYVPVFLIMGAWFRHRILNRKRLFHICGFFISFLCMTHEGMLLHTFDIQRHDSMYFSLLPCMYFLFAVILSVEKQPAPILRSISTWIYLLHPLMIILVRGIAKLTHCQAILTDNSLIHYMAVCFLSCLFADIISKWRISHKPAYSPKGRAWIELDKKNLYHNIEVLENLLPAGCKLMPAVKANAYGHGAVCISKALNQMGIDRFCVASISEGIELRKGGICGEILILGYTHPDAFPLLRKYNFIQTVVNYRYAKLLNKYGKPLRVHIKIDTGMHRLGERAEHVKTIARIFQMKNLNIEGAFTHLCVSDSVSPKDKAYTESQGKAFYQVLSDLKKMGYFCPDIHLLASYGLIHYPELSGNYARVGIALYGVLSNRKDMQQCKLPLLPVLSVKARIAAVKDLYKGESLGYGLSYTAAENRKIAVLPIGYADGIPRDLSCGKGNVIIKGQPAPIIGRICMDQMMIDITNIPKVSEGDIAILIGKSGNAEITAYDIAEQTDTITNEILSRLGSRLERLMI